MEDASRIRQEGPLQRPPRGARRSAARRRVRAHRRAAGRTASRRTSSGLGSGSGRPTSGGRLAVPPRRPPRGRPAGAAGPDAAGAPKNRSRPAPTPRGAQGGSIGPVKPTDQHGRWGPALGEPRGLGGGQAGQRQDGVAPARGARRRRRGEPARAPHTRAPSRRTGVHREGTTQVGGVADDIGHEGEGQRDGPTWGPLAEEEGPHTEEDGWAVHPPREGPGESRPGSASTTLAYPAPPRDAEPRVCPPHGGGEGRARPEAPLPRAGGTPQGHFADAKARREGGPAARGHPPATRVGPMPTWSSGGGTARTTTGEHRRDGPEPTSARSATKGVAGGN